MIFEVINILKYGDFVGITACSDARKESEHKSIDRLCAKLRKLGIEPIMSDFIYSSSGAFSGSGDERADALMKFYRDKRIKVIFDISGGDMCNELLDKIDYKIIAENPKPFFGYSDLATVINAIYSKTYISSCLYQIKNIIGGCGTIQTQRFISSIMENGNDLFDFNYKFIRGDRMCGTVLGGNIRCLLKLAGTEFMPDFTGKILFLESLGGGVERTVACMSQLRQLGIFDRAAGVLLGEFTYMADNNCRPTVEEIILREIGNESVPIARTLEIGHSPNSRAIMIGKSLELKEKARP